MLAGAAGTIVLDIIGYFATGQWWDIPALLGAKTGTGLVGGLLGHYGNGIILAVIYAAVAPSLWGPAWIRALTYITVEVVFAVWLVMLPLLGAGIAGVSMSPFVPVTSLLRHWGYGLALAALYPLGQRMQPGQAVHEGLASAGQQ